MSSFQQHNDSIKKYLDTVPKTDKIEFKDVQGLSPFFHSNPSIFQSTPDLAKVDDNTKMYWLWSQLLALRQMQWAPMMLYNRCWFDVTPLEEYNTTNTQPKFVDRIQEFDILFIPRKSSEKTLDGVRIISIDWRNATVSDDGKIVVTIDELLVLITNKAAKPVGLIGTLITILNKSTKLNQSFTFEIGNTTKDDALNDIEQLLYPMSWYNESKFREPYPAKNGPFRSGDVRKCLSLKCIVWTLPSIVNTSLPEQLVLANDEVTELCTAFKSILQS